MNLAQMTTSSLVRFDVNDSKKEDVIRKLTEQLYDEGYLNSKDDFYKEVLEREKLSATGFEAGLAIPHGKSKAVKKAGFAVARLSTPIEDWESIDPNNKVELVFLLAIPEGEAGSTHLNLLAELSTRLMDKSYYQRLMEATNSQEFIAALDQKDTGDVEEPVQEMDRTVLVVTACAAGIAHTYMAAEAMEQAGKKKGVRVYSEKQGANGLEDEHTAERINQADAVVFATDITPKGKDRFKGLPYVQTRVAAPLERGEELIDQALNNPDGVVESNGEDEPSSTSNKKQGVLAEMGQAILTGISYMIPVIVAAGLMMGIAKLGAIPFGLVNDINDPSYATSDNELFVILHHLDKFGFLIFQFMYPIFAAFTAYSLADRVGIVAGFIGGLFAAGVHYQYWGVEEGIPSGFLGALILGLTAGYIAKFLNEKIKLNKNFQAMKPMLIIPAISVMSIFLLNFYVVDPVFGGLNELLRVTIESAQESGEVVLSTIIASATAFDLGGPVNKAAGAIAIGLAADEIFPLTARVLAIVIPPIGLGLATVIDRFVVGRRVFDANLRVAGNTSILLGFIAISEGAIPFMLRNPLITIPINIIGAIIGSVTAVLLGAIQWYPLPAFWGWPLVENIWAYLIGLTVGALFIALANIFIRHSLIKKGRMTVE
ncbi:PTS fructose transporter subunit IIABC [Halobacillus andaensis]|uniref:PTS fructose transporter subunit IIABC n=1 Tax=Halobacillus andaensis TaxID=1176239 RepID=A0A917B7T9_HALAA|nr:fructose-specific PTS transporter subunit EIIC [Halobacillus andaensis]MBP2005310.1 PTS system fructose-specific IIC component [Halobacillus andaensis]GGF30512.1 PTS fructose transporter subunit IIABC [Halobacillus andaensis]